MRLETIILKNLIRNDAYTRKVLPFLKESYFGVYEDRLLYKEIADFIAKYNKCPSIDSLSTEVENLRGQTEETVKGIQETLNDIQADKTETNLDWLIDSTEKFCQERAIYNSITTSLERSEEHTSELQSH